MTDLFQSPVGLRAAAQAPGVAGDKADCHGIQGSLLQLIVQGIYSRIDKQAFVTVSMNSVDRESVVGEDFSCLPFARLSIRVM